MEEVLFFFVTHRFAIHVVSVKFDSFFFPGDIVLSHMLCHVATLFYLSFFNL